MKYAEFLAERMTIDHGDGFKVAESDINSQLFDFQRAIVAWACEKGRAAVFADCGLGKTPIQLEWARLVCEQHGGIVLIVAPLAVAEQTAREGEKFGVPVNVCRTGEDMTLGVNITNYEMLGHFTPDALAGIVLDECFPAGTKIDVPCGTMDIEDMRRGDVMLNASGVDVVSDVHRREVQYAVRITVDGKPITSSPNHPYFTQRGWVAAQDIEPGDSLVDTAEAVRMVRDSIHAAHEARGTREEILQSILLSEMADAPAGIPSDGAQSRGGEEARRESPRVACVGKSARTGGNRASTHNESHEGPGGVREDIPRLESEAPRTFRAWGERSWFDSASEDTSGCARVDLDSGICFVTGQADSRLSNVLQSRLGERRSQSGYRGGWSITSQSQGAGRKEGCETGLSGVDRLEVLESGHPDLERLRDADGKLYFYDLGGTWHPSFSIHGHLVHNSSILKSYDGKTRTEIIAFAERIPFRLACTATPAPNDPAELCNHAEFLGVMTESEVKALYFTTDGTTTRWRLKGHSHEAFYRWMTSWAVAMRKPSDLGFDDGAFELPPLNVHEVVVEGANITPDALFTSERIGISERRQARRASLDARVWAAANLANGTDEPFICWCDLNAESEALTAAIPDAVEVKGADSPQVKAERLLGFAAGKYRVLVSKPSIAGWGMNWQHCNGMAFVGLSDSYEQFYQAMRRCWRFGQKRPVTAYIVTSDAEGPVVANVKRKEVEATSTMAQIVEYTKTAVGGRNKRQEAEYREDVAEGGPWTLYLGDCVEVTKRIPTESVDLSVFSPPFPGMYTYSNSVRDIGNAKGIDDLMAHFGYLAPELLRVTQPGRSCFVHLTQYVAHINSDGFAGLKDFRGRTIEMMQDAGWRYYGEITIDKNPQVKAIRTKDRGLLFKTLATDSSMMHVALPDWVLHFRKDGENPAPIRAGISDKYGNPNGWITQEEWIRWARPVWYAQDWAPDGDGISETDVLNVAVARDSADERHICPLQLPVTERIVKLWSAPGEVVFSPFAGIGSEGHEAVRLGRRFVGIELKESYWKTACRNLRDAEASLDHQSLFEGTL